MIRDIRKIGVITLILKMQNRTLHWRVSGFVSAFGGLDDDQFKQGLDDGFSTQHEHQCVFLCLHELWKSLSQIPRYKCTYNQNIIHCFRASDSLNFLSCAQKLFHSHRHIYHLRKADDCNEKCSMHCTSFIWGKSVCHCHLFGFLSPHKLNVNIVNGYLKTHQLFTHFHIECRFSFSI